MANTMETAPARRPTGSAGRGPGGPYNGNGHAMNGGNGNGGAFAGAVRGELLMVAARITMMALWPALATFGYLAYGIGHTFVSRIVDSIDAITLKLDQTKQDTTAKLQEAAQSVRDLKQSVELGIGTRIDGHERELADHEDRLRKLEQRPAVRYAPHAQSATPAPPPSLEACSCSSVVRLSAAMMWWRSRMVFTGICS